MYTCQKLSEVRHVISALKNNYYSELPAFLPFWDKLEEADKRLLSDTARDVTYPARADIHTCTGECLGMIIVKHGRISVCMQSEEGRDIMLMRLSEGELCVLSASCVIKSINFDVHVLADTDTELTLINAAALNTVKNRNIYAECFVYKLAAEHFSDVMWSMQQILFVGFDKRLASYIYDETLRSGSDTIEQTHEQIAVNTGSAREVVSRMLKRFSDDGIIESKRGVITVLDRSKLKKLL